MLIEVEQFKTYNDRRGGVQGDLCLQNIAEMLKSNVNEGAQVYRFGGAMFTMVFPLVEEAEVQKLAQHLKELVAEMNLDHPETKSGLVEINTGVGCVQPSEAPNSTYLLEQADLDLAQSRID